MSINEHGLSDEEFKVVMKELIKSKNLVIAGILTVTPEGKSIEPKTLEALCKKIEERSRADRFYQSVSMNDLMEKFLSGELESIYCDWKIAETKPMFFKRYGTGTCFRISDFFDKRDKEYAIISKWRSCGFGGGYMDLVEYYKKKDNESKEQMLFFREFFFWLIEEK